MIFLKFIEQQVILLYETLKHLLVFFFVNVTDKIISTNTCHFKGNCFDAFKQILHTRSNPLPLKNYLVSTFQKSFVCATCISFTTKNFSMWGMSF